MSELHGSHYGISPRLKIRYKPVSNRSPLYWEGGVISHLKEGMEGVAHEILYEHGGSVYLVAFFEAPESEIKIIRGAHFPLSDAEIINPLEEQRWEVIKQSVKDRIESLAKSRKEAEEKKARSVTKRVVYSVKMSCLITYDPETEDEEDALSNIDVPEGGETESYYMKNSLKIEDIEAVETP